MVINLDTESGMARRPPPMSSAPGFPMKQAPQIGGSTFPSPSRSAPPIPRSGPPSRPGSGPPPPLKSQGRGPPPMPGKSSPGVSNRQAPIVYRPGSVKSRSKSPGRTPSPLPPSPSPNRGGPPPVPSKSRQQSYERPIPSPNKRPPPMRTGPPPQPAAVARLNPKQEVPRKKEMSEQTMLLNDSWENPEPQFAKPPAVADRIKKWQQGGKPIQSQKATLRSFKPANDQQEDIMYKDFEKNRIRGLSRVPRGKQGYGFSERFAGEEMVKQSSNVSTNRKSMMFSIINIEEKLGEVTAFGYVSDIMAWDCMVACLGCGLAGMSYGMYGNSHPSFGGADIAFAMIAFIGVAVLFAYRKYMTDRPEPTSVPVRALGMGLLGFFLLPRLVTMVAGILLLITAAVEYMAWRMGETYEYRKPRPRKGNLTYSGRLRAFMKYICAQTNRKKYGFAIVWLGISTFVFIERYGYYYFAAMDENSKSFGYSPTWLGVAKGAGTVIDLNACCMLLSVCRTFIRNLYNMITFGETSFALCLRSIFQWIPLDKNLQWHKFMSGIVYVMTWLHVAAHLFNYGVKKELVDEDFGAQIFVTGIILIILTHLIFCTSLIIVRMNKFEFFWYTHHLFIFYFFFNLVHGRNFWGPNFWKYFLFPGTCYTAERLLREHRSRQPVGIVSVTHMETKKAKVFALELEKKGALEHFRDGQYAFLKCMAVSQYQWHPFTIASAPEQKTAVFMIRRTGETTWTGRTQDYLKALGPKGKAYHKHEMRLPDGNFAPRTIGPDGNQIIQVDGPYAAPTQHCVEYYAAIIVGGGIGVTPLRATLQSLVHYKFKFDLGQSFPNYGYFHWGLRWADLPTYSFMFRTFREVQDEWENLQYKQKDIAQRKGFEFHLWITKQPDNIPPFTLPDVDEYSRWGPEFESPEARSRLQGVSSGSTNLKATVVENKKSGYSEADFLQAAWCGEECRIGQFFFHRGRAKWDEIFQEVRQLHGGACNKVAVPICGPKALGNSLKEKCAQYSDEAFEFVLHRENF